LDYFRFGDKPGTRIRNPKHYRIFWALITSPNKNPLPLLPVVILPVGGNNPSKVGSILQNQEITNERADKPWSMEVAPVNGPEDLREPVRGWDIEIIQLKPGKLQGSIAHFGVGNFGISTGQFNDGIRMRGAQHQERVVLGTILDCAGPVTQWWKDFQPGDVGVFPIGVEFDSIHCGGAAYVAVSIGLPELISMLEGDDRLADPAFWNTKALYHPDHRIGEGVVRRLKGIISDVERKATARSAQSADFLRRTIIEAFVMGLMSAFPEERSRSLYTGARLVSEAEDYIDTADGRPVHISELCSALRVSRRSLHRAFSDTLGTGPVTYLRRRRLSAIRAVLSRSDPVTISIGDLAFEFGFPEPSRFAAYYRAHFGEKPSDTLRSRSMGIRSQK
jgi:AraC family ethanolamine operon transcriptional activator